MFPYASYHHDYQQKSNNPFANIIIITKLMSGRHGQFVLEWIEIPTNYCNLKNLEWSKISE